MNELSEKVKNLASEYHETIIQVRRHLHQHPELSKEEHKTGEFIVDFLVKTGITAFRRMAGTGVVALISGSKPGSRVVALRADMDALPVTELNDVPYKSITRGVMHACGHDVHMATLLGAAKILTNLKNEFGGTVKLIFQPSEETYPGGAITMISEGVLTDPEPDVIIGQHVYPDLPAGMIGLKPGEYMASTDEVFITVKGKGGHAATPDKVIDPILIASYIIIALQQIVSRNARPITPTVISFGKIEGKGRTNVIPDMVKIEGIIRTYDEKWRSEIKERIRKISESIAEGMGGSCEVRIDKGYPALVNDEAVTERVSTYAKQYLGPEKVTVLEQRMTAEDFAYYLQRIPGCFYRLGVSNQERGITSNLHTATFDVDEDCLRNGMGLMAWMALNELGRVTP